MQLEAGAPGTRLRWNQGVADVAMALGLAALALLVAGLRDVASPVVATGAGPLTPVSAVLILAQTLPLVVRRRYPTPVLLVSGVAIGVYSGLGYGEAGGNFGVLVALYTVAAHSGRLTATVSAVFTALGVLLTFNNYTVHDPAVAGQMFGVYVEYSAAWVMGTYLRGRRQDLDALRDRAARLEREREERARLAVAEERARIARELHDVVAHHVSVMVVQAGAARRVVATDPASARTAMAAVESAGRTALAEMRRMLEVLRQDEPDLAPEPSITEVDHLVERVRAAGLPVDLRVEGERADVPAGVDLAAYRIVQEALTNVVKHAGKATASVRIAYMRDHLEVEVTDNGRGAPAGLPAESGGRGLVGMQERANLYGGTVDAGPRADGGYRVHAAFPMERADAAGADASGSDAAGGGYGVRRSRRPESLTGPLPERFRRTDEVFADPTIGSFVRVWYDAASGERRYRLDEPDAAAGA